MDDAALDRARQVLASAGRAVLALAEGLDGQAEALHRAVETIAGRCGEDGGRLACVGVGKAGLIARKLAATASSTGTPAFFLHPAEARHGDLGMLSGRDVVLALSNSGASEEVVAILPTLRHIGCRLIALVGEPDSPLGRHADVRLGIGRVAEACPLGLAPSTSTTCLLALGDALLLAVQQRRGFTREQYARFHPGGALGRRLMTCAEAMRSGERVAAVSPEASVRTTLAAITTARAGSALIIDGTRGLLGIFTDGDLRRALAAADPARVLDGPVGPLATMPCLSVRGDRLLHEALALCRRRQIDELPVVDGAGRLLGLLDLQDLLDRGFSLPGDEG